LISADRDCLPPAWVKQSRNPVRFARFGQRVPHPVLRFAFPAGHRLVEQLHHLVKHIGGRLRQHRQQDRMTPVQVA
jgi:hypothetical protein